MYQKDDAWRFAVFSVRPLPVSVYPSDMADTDRAATAFLQWFSQHGTQHPCIGLCDFPGMGRGVVALQDLPVRNLGDRMR